MEESAINFILELDDVGLILYILKLILISILSYYTAFRLINKSQEFTKSLSLNIAIIILVDFICGIIKYKEDSLINMIFLTFILSLLLANNLKCGVGYAILIGTISVTINCILLLFGTAISFIPIVIFNITNMYLNFIIVSIFH